MTRRLCALCVLGLLARPLMSAPVGIRPAPRRAAGHYTRAAEDSRKNSPASASRACEMTAFFVTESWSPVCGLSAAARHFANSALCFFHCREQPSCRPAVRGGGSGAAGGGPVAAQRTRDLACGTPANAVSTGLGAAWSGGRRVHASPRPRRNRASRRRSSGRSRAGGSASVP